MKLLLLLLFVGCYCVSEAASKFPDCWNPAPGSPGYLAPRTAHSRWTSRMALAYMDSRTIKGSPPSMVWTSERFERLLAYKSPDGKTTLDAMFDSVLIIGYVWFDDKQFWPGISPNAMNQTDWETYSQLQFDSGVRLIDAAAAKVGAELGVPDYKVGVVFMVPYPDRRASPWGTIGGKTLDFASNADRIAACEWYVDRILAMWKAAAPAHVFNAGFYWFLETIDPKSDEERKLVASVAAHVHQAGPYTFHWIPYFGAPGFDDWSDLGIDTVTLQPNFAFRNTSIDRFGEVAEASTRLHMGVELELPMSVNNPQVSGWKESMDLYLNASVAYHFNTQAMLTFYYGNDFVEMHTASYDYYTKLYQLVRGTYPNSP